MSDLPELRASDADRERVVTQLREQTVAGRLTLEEFSERSDRALAARTTVELDELARDLPAAVTPSRRRPTRFTGVAFGSVERKGRWRLGRWSLAVVAFGNADIDLRQAELSAANTTLRAFVLFGNIDIYVPQAVEADVGGLSIFGVRDDTGAEAAQPGAPLLRVRVFVLFGNADIWRVPAELAGAGLREVIRTLRRRR